MAPLVGCPPCLSIPSPGTPPAPARVCGPHGGAATAAGGRHAAAAATVDAPGVLFASRAKQTKITVPEGGEQKTQRNTGRNTRPMYLRTMQEGVVSNQECSSCALSSRSELWRWSSIAVRDHCAIANVQVGAWRGGSQSHGTLVTEDGRRKSKGWGGGGGRGWKRGRTVVKGCWRATTTFQSQLTTC